MQCRLAVMLVAVAFGLAGCMTVKFKREGAEPQRRCVPPVPGCALRAFDSAGATSESRHVSRVPRREADY